MRKLRKNRKYLRGTYEELQNFFFNLKMIENCAVSDRHGHGCVHAADRDRAPSRP